jgi:two-component system OmpR family response regulator
VIRVIRILVVDAEVRTRNGLAAAFRSAGFSTREVADRAGAEHALDEFRPDLVLLDPAVADGAGLELGRELADRRGTPLLIVAHAQTIEDRVAGLEVADDYVLKPADPGEVVARARAILRRTRGGGVFGALAFADVVLDESTHEVVRNGRSVELTPTEFELLRFFLLHPRRVLSKLEIQAAVWGDATAEDASTVETYVSYLRKKLDRLGPRLIHTVRLVGYVLKEA